MENDSTTIILCLNTHTHFMLVRTVCGFQYVVKKNHIGAHVRRIWVSAAIRGRLATTSVSLSLKMLPFHNYRIYIIWRNKGTPGKTAISFTEPYSRGGQTKAELKKIYTI